MFWVRIVLCMVICLRWVIFFWFSGSGGIFICFLIVLSGGVRVRFCRVCWLWRRFSWWRRCRLRSVSVCFLRFVVGNSLFCSVIVILSWCSGRRSCVMFIVRFSSWCSGCLRWRISCVCLWWSWVRCCWFSVVVLMVFDLFICFL